MAPTEANGAPASDFMFINHNAKRLKTIKDRSHRAVVNQHVQKAWLKDRKLKGPKPSEVTRKVSYDCNPSTDLSSNTNPAPSSQAAPYKNSQLIKFRTAQPRKPRLRQQIEVVPVAPFNALTRGNSDPFNTLAVPLDATVSHLLQYSREVMIPSVYSMEVRSTTPSLGATKAWEQVTLAFQDECAISAYLAISATSIMRIAPSADLAQVALKYNNRSSALLRQRIADSKNGIDPRLYIIVLWLSANALATGDFTAGMVHANTLCYLVKQNGGIAKVEPFARENVLQFDVQFAMMFLRRPFFDAKDYSPGPFNMDWLNDSEAVDNPSSDNKLITDPPLTISITSPQLLSILYELRELHAVYTFTLRNPIPGTSPMLRWMYLQKHMVEARLLDFCCDLIYSPIQSTTLAAAAASTSKSSPSKTSSSTSPSTRPDPKISLEYHSLLAPLSIALLYWTAVSQRSPTYRPSLPPSLPLLPTQAIHPNEPNPQLNPPRRWPSATPNRRSTRAACCSPTYAPSSRAGEPLSDQTASNPNAALRLWILYIGCMAEQALGLGQPADRWRDWCTRRFVVQTRAMGLRSHDACRDVLMGVLFADRMHRVEGKRRSPSEGRTAWGQEDVLVAAIAEGKRESEGRDKWDGRQTGFEPWWKKVQREFGGVGVVADDEDGW